jgi:YD repeat-containing protein
VENLGTIYYYAYDAAGKRIDVVLNGVLDTHQEFDAANQVLG